MSSSPHHPITPSPLHRWRGIQRTLAQNPWLQRASRLLALAAGALLIVGPLRPWGFVPFGGLRLPLYGLFGPAALLLPAGLLLLLHPRPGPVLLLLIAAGATYAALQLPPQMLAGARATTGTVETWLDPLNQLLSRFHIPEVHLTDWTLPAARAVGPGVRITLWGAGAAAAAALTSALATPLRPPSAPRACPACAAPLPRRRALNFCPACGARVLPLPLCRRCQSLSEPGDHYCGRCGEPLG